MKYIMFVIMVLFCTNLYAKKYEIVDTIKIGKDFTPINFDDYEKRSLLGRGVRLSRRR